MNIMLPAYDQNKQHPVVILEFTRETVVDFSKPAAYGKRFTHKSCALVSTSDGLIELTDVENLVIQWDLVPRVRNGRIIVPSFKTIERHYQEMREGESENAGL